MKFGLELRSRARSEEPIARKHARFMESLAALPAPWGLNGAAAPPAPDPGSALSASLNLGRQLGKGIRGHVFYLYRRPFEDRARHDDFVDLTFDPRRVDYEGLLREALPRYIEGFDCYMARVADEAFLDFDYDALRESGFDARRMVHRVHPVSYFDDLLCRTAFGLTAEQVAARLEGHVSHLQLLAGGVYVVAAYQPPEFDHAESISRMLRERLRAEAR